MMPRLPMIEPWMPVSSATSRTAACSKVSPASRCPFGSDHSNRPRRFVRPISAPIGTGPDRSSTRPPALVSSTRGSRGRRADGGRDMLRCYLAVRLGLPLRRLGNVNNRCQHATNRGASSPTMTGNPGELVPIPPVATRLADRFAEAGHQLYLVGGPVRDALMGRPVNDLDF